MKTIHLSIERQYTDGRKYDHFFAEGPLEGDHNCFETKGLSAFPYTSIDFKTGDIETKEHGIMHSGVPFTEEKSFMWTKVYYKMEDDGVPCNEDTLVLHLECVNFPGGSKPVAREHVDLPYRKGASITLTAYPYQATILELNDEEVTVEVKNGDKTATHVASLYRYVEQKDESYYATGNPNDPYDSAGSSLTLYLRRK